MGTRIEALQEMCAQFERNAADTSRERDALRETLGRVVAERDHLREMLKRASVALSSMRSLNGQLYVDRSRIQTFNSAPLWRRVLTAIRGDL